MNICIIRKQIIQISFIALFLTMSSVLFAQPTPPSGPVPPGSTGTGNSMCGAYTAMACTVTGTHGNGYMCSQVSRAFLPCEEVAPGNLCSSTTVTVNYCPPFPDTEEDCKPTSTDERICSIFPNIYYCHCICKKDGVEVVTEDDVGPDFVDMSCDDFETSLMEDGDPDGDGSNCNGYTAEDSEIIQAILGGDDTLEWPDRTYGVFDCSELDPSEASP